MSPTKLLSNSVKGGATLLGAVGIGAIALLGAPKSAEAASVWRGTDYLFTASTGATFLDFDGPGGAPPVPFGGVPIANLGLTDTVVQRKNDVLLDNTTLDADGLCISMMCQTEIEMTDLSLVSLDGSNITVTVDPNQASTGWMTINHEDLDTDFAQGTFSSVLDVFFVATFADDSTQNLSKRFVVGTNPYTLDPSDPLWKDDPNELDNPNNNAPGIWSHNPRNNTLSGSFIVQGDPGMIIKDGTADQDANWHKNYPPNAGLDTQPDSMGNLVGDFFVLSALHETGDGTHGVWRSCQGEQGDPCPPPIPEPSSAVSLALVGLAGLWGLRKKQSLK